MEERQAVNEVMDSGVLSQFLGTWAQFLAAALVEARGAAGQRFNGVAHAVSSATSGFVMPPWVPQVFTPTVIVSPYTMSASAGRRGVWRHPGVRGY